ncbi:hypothetical protein A2U01_0082517 [Trifolium medium]|uniref:Uncharacterized protein n=1 Tax=Trifolium medium TaxID=97028 RepID=A0A392TM97_9FABA|nr:hypothetical protein [Trifolium medium]
MVLSPQARLATASDQATESLPSTGDYWRALATSSPHLARRQHDPRQATPRTSPGDSTQNRVLCGG